MVGPYNYNFICRESGYGNETRGETNHLQLSPLLFSRPCTFLPDRNRSISGLSIRLFSRLCKKGLTLVKYLVLVILTEIKKVIAYLIKSI